MASTRPYALVLTVDQWRRAAHARTAIDQGERCVELSWTAEATQVEAPDPGPAGGLAFDSACWLYRASPDEGRVERARWSAQDPLRSEARSEEAVAVTAAPPPSVFGDFAPASAPPPPLASPRGLAVDADDRLFVAEAGRSRILVYDLPSRRLLRAAPLAPDGAPGPRPIGLAAHGRAVYAVTSSPAGLFVLGARSPARARALPARAQAPLRVAVSPSGRVALLDAVAGIFLLDEGRAIGAPEHATDIAFASDDLLVVARRPGEDFARLPVGGGAQLGLPDLKARGYDGRGIARAPDGRIVYWTERGFRHAVAARRRFAPEGRITTFRLDSGEWQTTWGRLFLDACIPAGTEVSVHCVAADEPPDGPTLARTRAENDPGSGLRSPELSPPMPPASFAPADGDFHPIHRRETGRELPWAGPPEGDRFATFEAPILAGPGRYLWVTLKLTGDTRRSPRVRCLRAEHPSHDYLRRLPRVFSQDGAAASFLLRYLMPVDGLLGDLDARAAERAALLHPYAAPAELLPWLASFFGLALDERLSVEQRRTLVAEIAELWRARGTARGLARMLEIYLGVRPVLLEHFRLRKLGGAVLGGTGVLAEAPVVGAGLRVGTTPPDERDAGERAEQASAAHAHRFTVLIPATLDDAQRAVVDDVLREHRPAHTIAEVCTVDSGVRVGVALYVGVSSIVGRGAGFARAQVGRWVVGAGTTLGRATAGARVGASRLGVDGRVG
ncbi:MAG TPA: phage tail protein [Sorangium sp.]|nr:phage tail protein [Sorangium sp.]